MKTYLLLINLLWLTSCVEQVKTRVRTLLGSEPAVVEETPASYKPEPPPAVDQDRTIQLTPKERLLSLFEQFNRSPDESGAGLVFQEFSSNKNLFSANRDESLISELNRALGHIQQGERLTIRLLFQLHPLLLGDNKEHLRGVLSRAFDSAPGIVSDYLGRSSEDKTCQLVLIIPPEVSPEARRDFLENRLNGLTLLNADTGLNTSARLYVDACVRALQLTLNPSAEMTPALPTESTPTP